MLLVHQKRHNPDELNHQLLQCDLKGFSQRWEELEREREGEFRIQYYNTSDQNEENKFN